MQHLRLDIINRLREDIVDGLSGSGRLREDVIDHFSLDGNVYSGLRLRENIVYHFSLDGNMDCSLSCSCGRRLGADAFDNLMDSFCLDAVNDFRCHRDGGFRCGQDVLDRFGSGLEFRRDAVDHLRRRSGCSFGGGQDVLNCLGCDAVYNLRRRGSGFVYLYLRLRLEHRLHDMRQLYLRRHDLLDLRVDQCLSGRDLLHHRLDNRRHGVHDRRGDDAGENGGVLSLVSHIPRRRGGTTDHHDLGLQFDNGCGNHVHRHFRHHLRNEHRNMDGRQRLNHLCMYIRLVPIIDSNLEGSSPS